MAKKKFCLECRKKIKGKRSYCESCLLEFIKNKNMIQETPVETPEETPETTPEETTE